jgi:hypothetical protein
MLHRAAFLLLGIIGLLVFPASATDMTRTKTISYRGGIVTFRVPESWREEYEPSGGGTFYEDRPDSGTLRLDVLSFSSKDEPAQQMALRAFPAGSYEILSNGFPIQYEIKEATEHGAKLHLHSWSIAVPIPPHSMRLVMFCHTVLAGQENDPLIESELDLLQSSIRSASFSQAPGVSGDFHQ